MRRVVPALMAAFVLALAAGCGGGDDNGSDETTNNAGPSQEAKKGGDLSVLYAADVDFIDPGMTYYQYGFLVAYATQRPLYSYKPDDAINPEPDLAEGDPQISDGGKKLTIKIRKGVKFSPPVNREVTTKDVKYAIERAFTKTVNGPYVGAFMSDIEGVKEFQAGKADEISGITTPDDQTIVFTLSRPAPRSSPAHSRCRSRRRCRRNTRRSSTRAPERPSTGTTRSSPART